MVTAALNTPKDHALYYRNSLGFSVFVLKDEPAKDRKRPVVNWEVYQEVPPTAEEIEKWFSINPNFNVAVVTGNISKIVAVDVDGVTAAQRVADKHREMSVNLWTAYRNTMVNRTGSGGTHIIFRLEEPIDISQKTIWRNNEAHSEIKIQGNGHYIVAAPSVHPNGNKYEWNGKEPELITRQQLNEFIRLVGVPELSDKTERNVATSRTNLSLEPTTTRTLTLDQMQELLSWVKPYYNPGSRNDIIFYLSGMMRKDAGFSVDTARRFIKLLCNSSGYADEDLDKSLTVVDNTYRKPIEDINGKSGLHDLIVTSYESSDEYDNEKYQVRAEAYSQICQIINGEPEDDDDPNSQGAEGGDDNNNDDDNTNNFAGQWLTQIKETYKDKKEDCPAAALLAQQILRLERFRTLEDTKEILWYHKGVFRYGGEERILSRLDELGGYGVNITIRREVTEYIKIKTFTPREEFDRDPFMRNVKNGVVDLRTGERHAHDPDKYPSLIQIPHNYYTPEEMRERIATRPDGSRFACKKIVFEFLCNVLDPEDVRLAIDYWGYCMIGDNKFLQKCLMDVGPPDSGKSTHIDITGLLIGEKNIAHKSLMQLTRQRFAQADLYGKLVNSCADISSSKLENVEIFKLIASGDVISAEKKGRDPFSFRPICKLMFSANTPPLPQDELDDAYYKRWIILVFGMKEKQFLDRTKDVEINRDLFDEIVSDTENELSDLLSLAVQAAKKLIREKGFSGGKRTRNIDVVREEYLRKAVGVKAWVEDNCVLGAEYEGEKPTMFADFNEYCRKEKLPGLASVTALAMKVMELYPSIKDHSVGKGKDKKHVWKGINIRSKLTSEQQAKLYNEELDLGEPRYE